MSGNPGRLRRLGARVSLVALAMGLSGALVVTTPSTAHALAAPPISPPVIAGAVRTMAPAAAVALNVASVTPIGFGIRSVVSLGMLAYSTSDLWMPYITGTFGQGDSDAQPDPQGRSVTYLAGLKIASGSPSAATTKGARYVFTTNYTGTGSTYKTYTVASWITCRSSAGVLWSGSGGEASGSVNNVQTQNTLAATCPNVGDTFVGVVLGARNAAPEFSTTTAIAGPENLWRDGASATSSFDPRSPGTTYTVTNECIDVAGTVSTISATTAGDIGALKMPSCEAAGKGHGTGKTAITGLAPGTTVPKPVWDSPRAPSDPSTPLCDAARSTGGCTLSIELDGSPCVTGNVECENWSEIQKNDPNNSRLKCRFGPYTLSMSQCAMLEKAYQLGGAPATDANVDGDPGTSSNLDPNGNPIPVQTAPTTGTVPGSSGQPDASTDPASSQCFPAGWAMFNPVQWVLQPIRCAFTPSPSTATNLTTRINTKISTVGFAPVAAAWGDAFQSVGGGSGCAGPTVNFSMNGVHQQFQPFNACSGVMQQAANVSTAILSLGVIFFGGLGIVRAIGSAFGFNFSMGGKTDGD